jgi:putative chitinase
MRASEFIINLEEGDVIKFTPRKSSHEKYSDAFSKQHNDEHRYGVGHIPCDYCDNVNCDYDCDGSQADGDLEEGLKQNAAAALVGLGLMSAPNHISDPHLVNKPAVQQVVKKKVDEKTVEQVREIMNKPLAHPLKKAAHKAGLKGKELLQFLAQCAHETQNFDSLKEYGGKLDFRKYDPKYNPKTARILGNTHTGDGARYSGGGYIQLTGRGNHRQAGKALGIPLEAHPELLKKPDVAAEVAVWYWKNRVAPKVNDFSNTAEVTKPINSHLNGLDDRETKFLALQQIHGLNEYKVDNKEGLGAVPYNQDVDYFGLRVMMKPSTFLKLALPLDTPVSVDHIAAHLEKGGALGAPFLDVSIPKSWDDGDFNKYAKITGHEGRNRMMAIQQVEGDDHVEVHIFPKGGYRNRDMTPEFVKNLNKGLTNQAGTAIVRGPLFSVV